MAFNLQFITTAKDNNTFKKAAIYELGFQSRPPSFMDLYIL